MSTYGEYHKKYYEANKEKAAAYRREYERSEKGKAAKKAYQESAKGKGVLQRAKKAYYLKLSLANCEISQRTLQAWAAQTKDKTPFCEWCFSEDNLEAHHILPKSRFPQYALDITNGRTMCESCHKNCHLTGGF